MTRYAMTIDLRRCVGCQTCTAACKGANATPPGVQWRRVLDLESGEFQFPIRVCNGCLISFASGDDPATPGLDCNLPLTAASGGGAAQLPCAVGRDETTPCQLCLNHEYPPGSKKFPCRTRE